MYSIICKSSFVGPCRKSIIKTTAFNISLVSKYSSIICPHLACSCLETLAKRSEERSVGKDCSIDCTKGRNEKSPGIGALTEQLASYAGCVGAFERCDRLSQS